MQVNLGKAIAAGIVGTAAMTVVGLFVAPLMGIPRMNPAEMLAMQMGGSMALGWMAHFMIGSILALIYALLATRLPGSPVLRGALFSLAPWAMAMLIAMPMMGMPLFGGAAVTAIGSLLGHLVYGMVLGSVYGLSAIVAPHPVSAR
jgi:uncharacterized membrane protein YagU involved in acid resistance